MAVEFEQEKEFERLYKTSGTEESGLTNWIIKTGIAKDASGAKTVMVIATLIFVALTVYLLRN